MTKGEVRTVHLGVDPALDSLTAGGPQGILPDPQSISSQDC
jgi:hypothetical protein